MEKSILLRGYFSMGTIYNLVGISWNIYSYDKGNNIKLYPKKKKGNNINEIENINSKVPRYYLVPYNIV